MAFIADHPVFAPEDPPDPRPEAVRENRYGQFFLSYDDASEPVQEALAKAVIVKDRQKNSSQGAIRYLAYHPSFEPRTESEEPLYYRLQVVRQEDFPGFHFAFTPLIVDCA